MLRMKTEMKKAVFYIHSCEGLIFIAFRVENNEECVLILEQEEEFCNSCRMNAL